MSVFVDWSTYIPWLETQWCTGLCTNLRFAFTTSAVLMMGTASLTCWFTKETPLPNDRAMRGPLGSPT